MSSRRRYITEVYLHGVSVSDFEKYISVQQRHIFLSGRNAKLRKFEYLKAVAHFCFISLQK